MALASNLECLKFEQALVFYWNYYTKPQFLRELRHFSKMKRLEISITATTSIIRYTGTMFINHDEKAPWCMIDVIAWVEDTIGIKMRFQPEEEPRINFKEWVWEAEKGKTLADYLPEAESV